MQDKLRREEDELKREKDRLIEEREAQRLQRYVSPTMGSSGRPSVTNVDKFTRSTSATVSDDRAANRMMRSDEVTDRHRPAYGYTRNDQGQVLPEMKKFPLEDGRSRTLSSDTAASRSVGQYQHQLTNNQRGQNPAAVTGHPPPAPVQSRHLPASSVLASSYPAARQSDNVQYAGPRTPRDEVKDRRRPMSTSLDGKDPRWTRDDARTASQPRPHHHPTPQRDITTPGAAYDHSRPQGHWHMASYEYGDSRKDATSAAVPTKSSTSSSQPDLLRYLDPTTLPPRPPVEPLRRSGDLYHQPVGERYPPPPAHARSTSNPVVLRSHGTSASSAAVNSLFAYHQKSNPPPAEETTPRPEPQTWQYVPPTAAVDQVSSHSYPRESERMCFHRRWFVCMSVCLSVTTITKKCGQICTKFYAKVPRGKGKTKFVFRYDG